MFRNPSIFIALIFSITYGELKDKYEPKNNVLKRIKEEQISIESIQTLKEKNNIQIQLQESFDIITSSNNVNINSRNSRSLSEGFEWQVFPPYKWYFSLITG